MRYLVDEGVPRRIAAWLASEGADVLYVVDSPYRGRPDRFLWGLAGEQRRVLVTRDIRFLLPRLQPRPVGVVLIRVPPDWRSPAITLLFQDALQNLGEGNLIDQLTVISPGRARRRHLDDLP